MQSGVVGSELKYYAGLKAEKFANVAHNEQAISTATRGFGRFNHLAETVLPPEPSQQSSAKKSAEISYEPKYRSVEEAQQAIHNAAREHAVIFDEGGKCLFEFIGTEDNVHIDPDLSKGAYLVIHNHPKGNIFSPDDIIWAMQNNIHELRVLCKGDGIYSFSPQRCNIDVNDVKSKINGLVMEALSLVKGPRYSEDHKRRLARNHVSSNFPGITKLNEN